MKIVMFCGGHGTRLWPVSRKSHPKPFVPLVHGESFFQITYKRFRKAYKPKDIFVSTELRDLKFVNKQAPEIPKENIILEPERRDTFAAYGLAIAVVNKYYPEEPLLLSWAKHLIARESVFLDAVAAAGKHSQETGMVVSVDAKPGFPSVHNGWIKKGEVIATVKGFKIVEQIKHVEKPKLKLAKQLFEDGHWLIHTGFKVCSTGKLLEQLENIQPAMFKGLEKITNAWGTPNQEKVLAHEYHKFVKTSADYGLLEKLPRTLTATIEADMGWEDLGISWETFHRTLQTPKQKTVIVGGADTEFIDAEDNLVIGPKNKMIGIVGLSEIAVIDTPDGLLVCSLSETQKVKDLYKKINTFNKKYTD